MSELVIRFDEGSGLKLYEQIYEKFKEEIETGVMASGVKMPSLRKLAKDNDISITTVETAYNQLLVEGYIESRPKSGYYVNREISPVSIGTEDKPEEVGIEERTKEQMLLFDEESFDFYLWKKSMNRVFNNYSHLLRSEADPQGEILLREEICKYLEERRGVLCKSSHIVVGAGLQQLTTNLVRVFSELGVNNYAEGFPGYSKVSDVFEDGGFALNTVKTDESGLRIEELGVDRNLVYVSPSNQFPTGTVMPVSRRLELIKWADVTDSYVLEDDFDSELRYYGKPVLPMKSLGNGERVIYFGSFATTLFAGIKISYMVLPDRLIKAWKDTGARYEQTCSKTEQLCLAVYMNEGHYIRTIKRCRKLYSAKLETSLKAFEEHGNGIFIPINSRSGMALTLKVKTDIPAVMLAEAGERYGMLMQPVEKMSTDEEQIVFFYFYRVSETMLKILIKQYVQNIKRRMERGASDGEIK